MNRTYLVQRLEKPHNTEGHLTGLSEAFSFGGGLVNGGLTKEAMSLLRPIFRFSYMGSAEFEFGAVPEALSKIVKNVKKYRVQTFKFDGIPVYAFAPEWNELDKTLKSLYDGKERLKEWSKFKESLLEDEYSKDTIGWLELDNAFFFFKDKAAFDKLVQLMKG